MWVETQFGEHVLEQGDLLFVYRKRSLLSRLVVKATESCPKISHVALYWGEDMVVDATWRGVVIRRMNDLMDLREIDLYMGRAKLLHGERNRLVATAFGYSGMFDYSYSQLFAIAVKELFGLNRIGDWDAKAVICSEFITALFRETVNQDLAPGLSAAESTPIDLYRSDLLVTSKIHKISEKRWSKS